MSKKLACFVKFKLFLIILIIFMVWGTLNNVVKSVIFYLKNCVQEKFPKNEKIENQYLMGLYIH